MTNTNRRVLLKSRPQGEPTPANFDVVDAPLPEPKDGEYLSRTIWLSLDPYTVSYTHLTLPTNREV